MEHKNELTELDVIAASGFELMLTKKQDSLRYALASAKAKADKLADKAELLDTLIEAMQDGRLDAETVASISRYL